MISYCHRVVRICTEEQNNWTYFLAVTKFYELAQNNQNIPHTILIENHFWLNFQLNVKLAIFVSRHYEDSCTEFIKRDFLNFHLKMHSLNFKNKKKKMSPQLIALDLCYLKMWRECFKVLGREQQVLLRIQYDLMNRRIFDTFSMTRFISQCVHHESQMYISSNTSIVVFFQF